MCNLSLRSKFDRFLRVTRIQKRLWFKTFLASKFCPVCCQLSARCQLLACCHILSAHLCQRGTHCLKSIPRFPMSLNSLPCRGKYSGIEFDSCKRIFWVTKLLWPVHTCENTVANDLMQQKLIGNMLIYSWPDTDFWREFRANTNCKFIPCRTSNQIPFLVEVW